MIDPIMKRMNYLRERIAALEKKCNVCRGDCGPCIWNARLNKYWEELRYLFWNEDYDEGDE